MHAETERAIRAEWAAARERPGHGAGPGRVAGAVYASNTHFELEQRTVFADSWLPLARLEDLPGPGSFVTIQFGHTPIALVRDRDGQVRAFVNACRHRGAQILRAESGAVSALVCPYHGFHYGLDGCLRSRPDDGSFCDKSDLVPIATEAFGGWHFCSLSGRRPLAKFLGEELLEELREWPFEEVRRVHRSVHSCPFDWKIGVEAFLESLHLPTIHQRTAHPLLDHRASAHAALGPHSRMSTRFRMPGAYGPKGPFGAIAEEAGAPAFEALNRVQRESNFSYLLFPCTVLNLLPNHFVTLQILPEGPGRCRLISELFTLPPGSESAAQYQLSLIPGYEQLLEEDMENLVWIQRGTASGAVRELELGSHEVRIRWFRDALRAAGAATD